MAWADLIDGNTVEIFDPNYPQLNGTWFVDDSDPIAYEVVPLDRVPDEVYAALAKYRLENS